MRGTTESLGGLTGEARETGFRSGPALHPTMSRNRNAELTCIQWEIIVWQLIARLLALFPVEVHACRFAGFHLPCFEDRHVILAAHFNHKIHQAGDRQLVHMGTRDVWDVDVEHATELGDQDAMVFDVNMDDRAVIALISGKADAAVAESEDEGEKNDAHVRSFEPAGRG